MSKDASDLFQYFLEHYFNFPHEIKNDLIYCQRALKSHIEVHQMVLEVFQQQGDADPIQKKRILENIESEIYEINAEQHYLFLRLRRIIDQFYKLLNRNGVKIDQNYMSSHISKTITPSINDASLDITPISVLCRNSREKLIEKYFEVQKEKKEIEEVMESDDDDVIMVMDSLHPDGDVNPIAKIDLTNDNIFTNVSPYIAKQEQTSKVSLLKPISQRMVKVPTTATGQVTEMVQLLQNGVVHDKQSNKLYNASTIVCNVNYQPAQELNVSPTRNMEEKSIALPVSKNVKRSRLNLRQALKKARTENMAAKAAANALASGSVKPTVSATQTQILKSKPIPAPSPPLSQSSRNNGSLGVVNTTHPPKRYDNKNKAARIAAATATAAAAAATVAGSSKVKVDINSSSDDSNPERGATPTSSESKTEPIDVRTMPEHYEQTDFLRIFNLFTPEVLLQMQQRRSKRKRRTVHSNERADFHYGRIEYGSFPNPEVQKKKRKAFLLSPQVKRKLQAKRPKRASAEKNEDVVPSRSSSSSPDEKRACNECLKNGGYLEDCTDCKGFFHQSCHQDEDEEMKANASKNPCSQTKFKLCPACKRTQKKILSKEFQYKKVLQTTAEELQLKIAKEKDRRASLQHASKMYKIQMRNLYNIVNTFKSDHENDGSSD